MKRTLHNVAAGLQNRLRDNELDADGQHWLADHRVQCAACDARFRRVEAMLATLATLDRPEPGPDFADRILAEVRPAPAPLWARWRIAGAWRRAAAAAVLAAAGVAVLLAPAFADAVVRELGGPAFLFSGPGLLAAGLVSLLNEFAPFGALTGTAAALARVVVTVAGSPQVLAVLAAGALVSAAAFVQLSHMLAVPHRRRSSNA